MDVHCSSCSEPWDVYHLRYAAIFETELHPQEAEKWQSLSPSERLSSYYREVFKKCGYEFVASIVNVVRCPFCP